VNQEIYEQTWRRAPLLTDGTIHMLVVRVADGVHDRPDAIVLHEELGVLGDRWLRHPTRTIESQVTLIERRVAELLTGPRERWHVPGDNIVVDLDLSKETLPTGARIGAGDVILEITEKPHAGCNKFRSRLGDDALRWVNDRDHRGDRLRGVHARVLRGGVLRVGDRLQRR
jgi:hypothetical protein